MYLSAKQSSGVGRIINGETPAAAKLGRTLGIVFLCLLIVPSSIFILYLLVHNWGWWRLKQGTGTRHFVKTWKGWVDREKYEENIRRHENRNIFGVRVTTAHIVQVSWTPDGVRTKTTVQQSGPILQWLSGCFGLCKKGNRCPGRSTDIELGTIPEPPTICITKPSLASTARSRGYPRPLSVEQLDGTADAASSTTARVLSGTLRDSSEGFDPGNTVRQRKSSTSHSAVWQANSSETSRATATQFIQPVHNIRTPVWADRLFGNGSSWDTTTPVSSRKATSIQIRAGIRSQDPEHILQDAQIQTSNAARRAVRSSPAFSPPLATISPSGLRSSTQLSATIDLDNLESYLERGSRYGPYGSLASSTVVPFDTLETYALGFPKRSQSLTQRLKARARPSISSLFPHMRRRFSRDTKPEGLDREHGDIEDAVSSIGDPLQEYEDEGSIDGILTYHEDIQPYSVATASTSDAEDLEPKGIPQASQVDLATTNSLRGSYGPLASITNLPMVASVAQSHPPGQTSQEESSPSTMPGKWFSQGTDDDPEDPTTPQLLARKVTTPTSHIPSMSLGEPRSTAILELQPQPLSAAERAHRDELRRRLQGLDLRCTVRGKDPQTPIAMNRDAGALTIAKGGEEGLKGKQGLRRVGACSDLSALRMPGGKENASINTHDDDIGRWRGKVSIINPSASSPSPRF